MEMSQETPPTTTKVTIPKARKRTPLLKHLPGSLPLYRMGMVTQPPIEVQIALPKNQFPQAMENLGYYITDGPVSGAGEVTATEMDTRTAGDYQYIYVRLHESGGKEFIAQKNAAEIKDPQQKDRKGQMVEIQGQIEILERVNEAKDIYRAIVKKSHSTHRGWSDFSARFFADD